MSICEYCNKENDTRPYGENGARICFDCAMSTPERKAKAEQVLAALFDSCASVSNVIVVGGEDGPVPYAPNKTKLN
jgi:hypothetical protein